MSQIYNIYCDESCHLEHDGLGVMVLGAVCCPLELTRDIASKIRQLKTNHNLPSGFEAKWTKVSPAKVSFYTDLINYFFNENNLSFRVLVVPDKSKLQHSHFSQTHDEWYYKMYFTLLKAILDPQSKYKIYLDIKDTHSSIRVAKLKDVIRNSLYDFNRQIIENVQPVHSHEVEQIQLADLLTGAVSYANRQLNSSVAKTAVVDLIRTRSGYSLTQSTLLREKKFNAFVWHAQEGPDV
jgi:hypothetical protein